MSLNFKFPDNIDKSLIEYTRDDGSIHWHPRAQSLIFYMMMLQHNMDGPMTESKLREIDRRINLIDLHHQHPAYWEDDNGYRIQLADIVTYWGLTTNVCHLPAGRWNTYYNRCFTKRIDTTPDSRLYDTNRQVYTTRPLRTA
jgi:hypothetical protein